MTFKKRPMKPKKTRGRGRTGAKRNPNVYFKGKKL